MSEPPRVPNPEVPPESPDPGRSGLRIAAGVVVGLVVLPLALVASVAINNAAGAGAVLLAFVILVGLNYERGFGLGAGIGCATMLLVGGGACVYLISQFNA